MPKVTLNFDSVPLPEGWTGTPQQLLTILVESLTATAEGDFLTGKIGGARPVIDSGLFISNGSLEIWSEEKGKYVTADGVPVGVIMPWASNNPSPPANWLFCQGQTLQRTEPDYAELYEAIGFFWGQDGTDGFKLPDCRGRVFVGAGTGNYDLDGADPRKVGRMIAREAGTYFGEEWIQSKFRPAVGTWQNPPIGRSVGGSRLNTTYFTSAMQPAYCAEAIIKYR